jgi:hypothetical protein
MTIASKRLDRIHHMGSQVFLFAVQMVMVMEADFLGFALNLKPGKCGNEGKFSAIQRESKSELKTRVGRQSIQDGSTGQRQQQKESLLSSQSDFVKAISGSRQIILTAAWIAHLGRHGTASGRRRSPVEQQNPRSREMPVSPTGAIP